MGDAAAAPAVANANNLKRQGSHVLVIAVGNGLSSSSAVDFTYVVTNSSTGELTDVAVTDDRGVDVVCPHGNPIPVLGPGENETCTGTGTVTAGPYRNRGSATGTVPGGERFSVSDPSNHFGVGGAKRIPTVSMLGLGLVTLLLGGIGARAAWGLRR